ncbi:MAG: putative toxin-antitoxin system toxin component, PIN family [Spirulina sp.]
MTKLRLVLDTNVLISGLLTQNSIPQQVYDYAIAQAILLQSQATLAELERVLLRPKFDRYVSLEKRLRFIASVIGHAEYIDIYESIELCRDPKDDSLLELAVSGSATHLVTGDQDLLVLRPFRNTVIQTPSAFLADLRNSGR